MYDPDSESSMLTIWVDSQEVRAQAVAARVSYDFTSDGLFFRQLVNTAGFWDHEENFMQFPPDDIVGFENWTTSEVSLRSSFGMIF